MRWANSRPEKTSFVYVRAYSRGGINTSGGAWAYALLLSCHESLDGREAPRTARVHQILPIRK
jgi:hypothetical protein